MNPVKKAVDAVMNTLSDQVRSLTDDQYHAVLADVLDEVDSRLAVLEDHDDDEEDDDFDAYLIDDSETADEEDDE